VNYYSTISYYYYVVLEIEGQRGPCDGAYTYGEYMKVTWYPKHCAHLNWGRPRLI